MAIFNRLTNSRLSARFVMLVLAMTLIGCASGDPYGMVKDKLPTIKGDMGRIFVYRSINPLAMFNPRLFTLDGKHVGDTYASTILYHDVSAGKHTVNYNGGRDKLAIMVPAGGKIYLKYSIVGDSVAIGNTAVAIIDGKTAEGELGGVHLIKTEIRNPDELK